MENDHNGSKKVNMVSMLLGSLAILILLFTWWD